MLVWSMGTALRAGSNICTMYIMLNNKLTDQNPMKRAPRGSLVFTPCYYRAGSRVKRCSIRTGVILSGLYRPSAQSSAMSRYAAENTLPLCPVW